MESYVEDRKIIELDVEGPAEITAGDILTDSDVEIVNPDHYLLQSVRFFPKSDNDC